MFLAGSLGLGLFTAFGFWKLKACRYWCLYLVWDCSCCCYCCYNWEGSCCCCFLDCL